MQLIKHVSTSKSLIPLISALPYSVIIGKGEGITEEEFVYNPTIQRTVYADGARDYSTCREDDSVGVLSTKSDTKKDD